jgi:hypothetical protein
MILDLIVILLVIVLSYLLCIDNKNHNCQLSHIVIGLTVIVFYKLSRYYNTKLETKVNNNTHTKNKNINTTKTIKEGFNIQNINDFLSNKKIDVLDTTEISSLEPEKYNEYLTSLNNLVEELKEINNNNVQNNNSLQNTTDVESSSLEAQQALQQYQINYLNKQIKNSQDIINNERINEETLNYKPIKVYSSCTLNTDGSLSNEEPVKNKFTSVNPLNKSYSYEDKQILNTIQQGNPEKQNNVFLKLLQQL